ncbi:Hypothetical predicted protein, partial [Mytilus galloprovincialis]
MAINVALRAYNTMTGTHNSTNPNSTLGHKAILILLWEGLHDNFELPIHCAYTQM